MCSSDLFNEAVKQGTGTITLLDAANGTIPSTVTFAGSTVTINPVSDLATNAVYHVAVAAGAVLDIAGNAYAGITDATTLNFTTAGAVVPPVGSEINLVEGTSYDVAPTSGADVFTFDVAAARATADNTQINITTGFNLAADTLKIDTATLGATTLAALNGVDGITVQSSTLLNTTVVNFGADANGDVIALTLVGVIDPALVHIAVV